MKKGLLLFLVFTLLFCFLLTGCDGLDALFDEENGSSEDGSPSVQKHVMPDVVGKHADEASSTLKKAKITVTWNYATQDDYILQYYGSKTNAAPPDSYSHIWVVKKQSVEAGQENTEQVTLTVDLDIKVASNETAKVGNVVRFSGTIIDIHKNVSTGTLTTVIIKTSIPASSDSNEQEHLCFWAKDGPSSKYIRNGSIFDVAGIVTRRSGSDIWINILSMSYRGQE